MMDDAKLIELVEQGITKIPHNKLAALFQYVTGKPLNGKCSECAKRNAIKKIIRYYKKLKNED